MAVRAKFKCYGIELFGGSRKIKWMPVYEGSLGENEENKRFTQATPSGECWLTIDNPYASEQFDLGQECYVTFEPIAPAA